MQNMPKTTHDRPLTGVHWPIHRGWCRASGAKGDLSASTGGTEERGGGLRLCAHSAESEIVPYARTRVV